MGKEKRFYIDILEELARKRSADDMQLFSDSDARSIFPNYWELPEKTPEEIAAYKAALGLDEEE